MNKQPADLDAESLRPGMVASFERSLVASDIDRFADLSWDHNPLHTDDEYSAGTVFGKRVAHGAFQLAMVSALIGMFLPGRRALIAGINAKFQKPMFIDDHVIVHGELVSWNRDLLVGRVRARIRRTANDEMLSETMVDFTLHAEKAGTVAAIPAATELSPEARGQLGDTILVTGASGGLGQAITRSLASTHSVIATYNQNAIADDLDNIGNVMPLKIDLASKNWEYMLRQSLASVKLAGIVHAAWAGMPRGGLLESEATVLTRQMAFASHLPIGLARILRDHAAPSVSGRGPVMLMIGSTAGSYAPNIATAGYSLAKSLLEDTVRLLAPELAAQGITINVLAPGLMPIGINDTLSDRQTMIEKAKIPMGRLCQADDVSASVAQFFDGGMPFVSGQTIVMAGGQL
jgi:NAD(P)-dependent dehydrogenase (short-subunit alcohol dehydrogenase family)/acyl dehydratase